MAKISAAQHARTNAIGLAKIHTDAASAHDDEAASVGTDNPIGNLHKMIASFHKAAAAHAASMLEQSESMGKSYGDELVPTDIRGVIVPRASELFEKIYGNEQPVITAIPRAGQPQMKADVPVEFEFLTKTEG